MNKEEILEKSRQENKGQDVYEQEIIQKGASYAILVATALATVFFIAQILLGGGQNYGLYAILGAVMATQFIVKAKYLKRKHEIVVAVMYSLLTVLCIVAHFMQLLNL